MADGRYRVDELAAAAGVSVDTVRYYQGRGLLPPPERSGRVARYSEDHLTRLREIRRLVDEGLTLAQVGRVLESRPGAALEALLELGGRPDLSREELAERAGVPEAAVDLAVEAGLLHPVVVDGEPRFEERTVAMLAAGARLLDAGVPLPALLQVAADHAEHTERLVDRAVELFSAREESGDRLAAVRDLIPRVTELVAEHFRQTLLSRVLVRLVDASDDLARAAAAVERATATRRPQLLSLSRRLDSPLDPLDFLAASDSTDRMAVLAPDDGVEVAGAGVAHAVVHPGGDDRFHRVAAEVRRVANTIHRDRDVPDWAAPALLGGFAYFADAVAGGSGDPGDWAPFGAARFVLPELYVARRRGETWVSRTCTVAEGDDPKAVVAAFEEAVAEVARTAGSAARPTRSPVEPGAPDSWEEPDDPGYRELVERALRAIDAGELEKVVCARSVLVPGMGAEPAALLGRLRRERPGCTTFWFETGGSVFVGSTPELLVRLDGAGVTSAAVAGTIRRSDDPDEDERLARSFLDDPKELAEHRFVLDALRDRLVGAGVLLDPSPPTGLLDLPGLRHLHTPVTGRLANPPGSVVELAGALHPTPAVSGSPLVAAERWLRDHESLDRGWYAAPVGVVRLDGGGALWVGLRSALVLPAGTRLYAGAGIVAGSDPARELAETQLKLRTMRAALATGATATQPAARSVEGAA